MDVFPWSEGRRSFRGQGGQGTKRESSYFNPSDQTHSVPLVGLSLSSK